MKSIIANIFFIFLLQACKSNQDSLAAQYNTRLGLAYLSQGDTAIAKSKLFRAFSQQPQAANVNSALAYFMEISGDITRADNFYRRAIKYSKNRGLDFNNYAAFLCRQSNYQKANRYFMLAVNDVHYANTAEVYANAGHCNLFAKQEQTAVNFFEQSLLKDSKLKDSLFALVRIYLHNNDIRKVCELLKKYAIAASSDVNLVDIAHIFCLFLVVN